MNKRRNIKMIVIIIIATILLLIGGSYAYFSVIFQDERTDSNNGNTNLKTCSIAEATTITDIPESIGSFNESNIYPGHKEVTSFKVSASGSIGSTSSFKINYHVIENGLGYGNVKVSVYKSKEEKKVTNNYFECEKKIENIDNETRYYEECKEKPLGNLIEETILSGGSEEIAIGNDTLLVREQNKEEIGYYYVVVEFLNKEESQNEFINTHLNGKITIEATNEKKKYKESILNGTDPVIKDELIPVFIEDDGTVRKADESSDWYNYENKEWANAIILKNENEEYCPYEVIPEDNIESYFVWIPKYRYQLWDLGNYDSLTEIDETKVHTIPLIFGDYDTNDSVNGECTTPMESGASGNCKVGDYMTHPAFLSIPSTGFWVGKFETSKSNDKEDNNINPDGIQIKPNVTSWRNIQVANAFYTTYDYKRNLDSHMMKNTEWGAVAYLQHSEYGSHTKIRFNNNSDYKTGFSSVNKPTCGYTRDNRDCNKYGNTSDITLPYNTETGYLASTTGNISGIYDMSGGNWEYVMSIILNENDIPISNETGFKGLDTNGNEVTGYNWPEEKYFNKYLYGIKNDDFSRKILGDATGELGSFGFSVYADVAMPSSSWYFEHSPFIYYGLGIFNRGGGYDRGNACGIFAFGHNTGIDGNMLSFRLVLTPTH